MTGPPSLLDQPMVYGARARLGVIVPPTNTANEAEWNRMAPAGVSIHAARMPLHTETTSAAGRAALYADIERYALDLAKADVSVIAYGCTAGSMVEPMDALGSFMRDRTGTPALTTAQGIVESLRALNVQRVAVGTPYHDALNDHEARFLTNHGFTVTAIEGLGYGAGGPHEYRNIARIDASVVRGLAGRVDSDAAEALLLSCTDLGSLDVIPGLEEALQKPVVSSNTATFWAALRMAGVEDAVHHAGRLLVRCRG